MKTDIEFEKCVRKEMKKEFIAGIQELLSGAAKAFIKCLKVLACIVIAVVVFVGAWALFLDGLCAYLVSGLSQIGPWIAAHYFIAGLIIVGFGVIAFIIGVGIFYVGCLIEEAVVACDARWKEHSLVVDLKQKGRYMWMKDGFQILGVLFIIGAFILALCGGLIANYVIVGVGCLILLVLLGIFNDGGMRY